MEKLIKGIENNYKKHFPKSMISIDYSTGLYNNIRIKCYLAGNKAENSGSYWENDMLSIGFSIETKTGAFSKDTTINSNIENMELVLKVSSKSYYIKPIKNIYQCFEQKKLQFRKIKGNNNKILKKLDVYFETLKATLKEDLKNNIIHENYKELLKEKMEVEKIK